MPKPISSEKLNPLALSRVELASILTRTGLTKLTPAAVGNWLNAGAPRNTDKTYNIVYMCAWLAGKYGQTPYRPSAASDEETQENIRLKRSRRLKLDQARRIEAGKFIEKVQVEEDQQRKIHALKSGLLMLSRVLAREIAGKTPAEVQKITNERVNALLEAYSHNWDGSGSISGMNEDGGAGRTAEVQDGGVSSAGDGDDARVDEAEEGDAT